MARVFLQFSGDMEGAKIIDLGAGSEPGDAVNRGQLDAVMAAASAARADATAAANAAGAKIDAAEKGQAGGVATLDGNGKVPSSQLPAPVGPVVILSGTDHAAWIDLNSTVEQMLKIPHTRSAVLAEREVFFEPIADAALDVSAVEVEYVKYLSAQSTATEMVFAVKLRAGTGVASQQGQLRILMLSA